MENLWVKLGAEPQNLWEPVWVNVEHLWDKRKHNSRGLTPSISLLGGSLCAFAPFHTGAGQGVQGGPSGVLPLVLTQITASIIHMHNYIVLELHSYLSLWL